MSDCTDGLNSQSQMKENFGFGWSQFNQSYTPPSSFQLIYDSFQYQDWQTLQDSSSTQGQFNSYDGGGYVFALRGSLSYLQGNLTLLQQLNWIDKNTRAVFAEFSAYNTNINLVMVASILVEFLESGAILMSAKFQPLNLFGEIGTQASFKLILLIVFISFIAYFMLIQIREAINKDIKEYLTDFWTYIEWCIIGTAWYAFAMFIIRLMGAIKVLTFFHETKGYDDIRLQTLNDYNIQLTYSLGMCVFFTTLKILKILRFNKSISILGLTLKNCFSELASFSIVFFVVWFSFVQLMFLLYGNTLQGYSSLLKTMASSFLVMIGKSNSADVNKIGTILAPAIYALYSVIILYFVLNIFVSIIIDSFEKVRVIANENKKNGEIDFFGYLRMKFRKNFERLTSRANKLPTHKDYQNHMGIFSNRIDALFNMIYRVN
jgi:polycystin 2